MTAVGMTPRVAKDHGTSWEQGLGSSGLSHGKVSTWTEIQTNPSQARHAAVKTTNAVMTRNRLGVTSLHSTVPLAMS